MSKIKIISTTLRVAIALVFLLAGVGKFQTDSIMAENFKNWDLGIPIMFIVGITEVIGAILLLIPKTIKYGCYSLILVMLGATIIHFLNFKELGFPLLNITLIVLLMTIIYLDKTKNIKS